MNFAKRLWHMVAATIAAGSLLAGCGGSGDAEVGAAAPPPATTGGQAKTLAVAVSETTGPNCPYGGSKVSAGVDANGNGVLDSGEVNSMGSSSATGRPVPPALQELGLSSLVNVGRTSRSELRQRRNQSRRGVHCDFLPRLRPCQK